MLPITFLMVFLSMLIGTVLGFVVAVIRIERIPILNQISIAYISFMRGTPVIVQLFIVYFGLSALLENVVDVNNIERVWFVILCFGLNLAAFLGEDFRCGIEGVPLGQRDAAYSIGMSKMQLYRRIILPQAIIMILPAYGINMIGAFQATAYAFTLGVLDVVGKAIALGNVYHHTLEGYIVVAVLFVAISALMEQFFKIIENRACARFH